MRSSSLQRTSPRLDRRLAVWLLAAMLALFGWVGAAWAEDPRELAPRDMPDILMPSGAEVPPVPSTFTTREDGWIRISYPPSEHGRVDGWLQAAHQVRAELTEELGRPVLERVEVRIARDFREMASLTPIGAPPPDYAEGVAYARSRLVLVSLVAPNSSEPPRIDEVLKHELAHVALFDAVGGRPVPRWFNEGYAVHASGESSLVRTRTLWTATLGKRVLPMSDLDRSFPAHSDMASIAYAQSADFVRFLLRRQDRARFVMFIDRLAQGDEFESAISDSYSADLRRLEFQWREEITKRYSWAPVIVGGGFVWLGAVVLVALAWVRRRRQTRKTLARWEREELAEERRKRELRQPPLAVQMVIAREQPAGFPAPTSRPSMDTATKVEHDGRWHTLH
jgi:hypothetical protein